MRWFVFVHGFASCECVCVSTAEIYRLKHSFFLLARGFPAAFPFQQCHCCFFLSKAKMKMETAEANLWWYETERNLKFEKKLKKQSIFFWCEKKFYINFSNFQKHTWTSKTKNKKQKSKTNNGNSSLFLFLPWNWPKVHLTI